MPAAHGCRKEGPVSKVGTNVHHKAPLALGPDAALLENLVPAMGGREQLILVRQPF